MGIFTTLTRKSAVKESQVEGVQSRELPDGLRGLLPARFEALGEALAAGLDVAAACAVTGRELARDGVDMGGALGGLRATYDTVLGREPDFAATEALSVAWSDETLAYMHQLSCEDPLTGLSSLAHLRARLTEIYRGVEQRDESTTTSALTSVMNWALVVVELPPSDPEEFHNDPFEDVLRTAHTAEVVRLVFPGSETLGQIAPRRIALITERTEVLGRKVAALRTLLQEAGMLHDFTDAGREGPAVRVWIEGLPSTNAAAGSLLDELARA